VTVFRLDPPPTPAQRVAIAVLVVVNMAAIAVVAWMLQ